MLLIRHRRRGRISVQREHRRLPLLFGDELLVLRRARVLAGDPGGMPKRFLRLIEDWQIDGVMVHLARRCAPLNLNVYARMAEVRQAGIPLGTYEASEGDPKEWNESRVREDFERFFESLGLTHIGSLEDIDRDLAGGEKSQTN